jgi:hypothetical protein
VRIIQNTTFSEQLGDCDHENDYVFFTVLLRTTPVKTHQVRSFGCILKHNVIDRENFSISDLHGMQSKLKTLRYGKL